MKTFLLALMCLPATAAWLPTGPYGGDAAIIRTVPQEKDQAIAAGRNGLLFRSVNGGASWDNIFFPAQFSGILHAFEIDPHAGTTWFAGMDSDNEWSSGVYKTTDAGKSWALLAPTRGLKVWSLAIWPKDSAVMAAGTGSGVFLSQDHGTTWNRISREGDPELQPVVSLAFHPTDSAILYAGTTHLPWRTGDSGATWKSIHTGMIDDSDVFSIVVDPKTPTRVFASACSGVYSSIDSAGHWTLIDTPTGAYRTHFVSLDPRRPNTVFAGTTGGLLKSDNGGRVWRKITPRTVHSIAYDSTLPNRIFFASDAGVLISADGGNTLRESNVGFTNRNFTALTGAAGVLYSSSVYEPGSKGAWRSENLALRWVHAGGPAGDETVHIAVSPVDPKRVFAAGYHGLSESHDGGQTWKPRKAPAGVIAALAVTAGGALLAGTDQGLQRSETDSWAMVEAGNIQSISVAGKNITAIRASGAMLSLDGGTSWSSCGEPAPGVTWYGLALEGATGLAATSAGLYRSTDLCRTWSEVRAGAESETATIVLFHPTRAGQAFATQGGRVLVSNDAGQHWSPLDDASQGSSGPSSLLILSAAPERLFALFPRRGVYSAWVGAPEGARTFQ